MAKFKVIGIRVASIQEFGFENILGQFTFEEFAFTGFTF